MPDDSDKELDELNAIGDRVSEETNDRLAQAHLPTVRDGLADLQDLEDPRWSSVEDEARKAELANLEGNADRLRAKSPQACYAVDLWTSNYARHLCRECSTGEPLDLTGVEKLPEFPAFIADRVGRETDLDPVASVADFFAFCFDPDASVRIPEETTSVLRHKFLAFGEEAVDAIRQLRASTCGDVFGSTLGAETLFSHYQTFLTHLVKSHDELKALSKSMVNMPSSTEFSGVGLGSGGNRPLSDEEIRRTITMTRAIRQDPKIRKIMLLAGKYWIRCLDVRRHRVTHEVSDGVELRLGREIRRSTRRELSRLGHPITRLEVFRKIAGRSLMTKRPLRAKTQVRGPIVVAVDESGSMGGITRGKNRRIEEAKGVALAMANLARLQRRWFALVSWSCFGDYRAWAVPPTQADCSVELTEFASHFYGGGTTLPLSELITLVDETCKGGIEPDLVIITDGDLPSHHDYEDQFIEWRRRRNVRVVGISIASESPPLERICTNYYGTPDLAFGTEAVDAALGTP